MHEEAAILKEWQQLSVYGIKHEFWFTDFFLLVHLSFAWIKKNVYDAILN